MTTDDKPIYAKNYLVSKWKLSPVAAAGIVGNLQAESGFNTKALGDGSTSYGIAQWHNERRTALNNFAKKQNKDASHIDTQLDYLVYELNTGYKKALNNINRAKTPEEAAIAFMNDFERPAEWAKKESVGKRTQYAKNAFGSPVQSARQEDVPIDVDISENQQLFSKEGVVLQNNTTGYPNDSPDLDETDEEPTVQYKSDLAKDRLEQQEKQEQILSQLFVNPEQLEQPQEEQVQQPDPLLYRVYDIQHPEYNPPQLQKGGQITPKQFYSDYLSSPKYKQRLYNMGRIDADEVISDRMQNLFHTDIVDVSGTGSQYMADDKAILIDKKEIDQYNMDRDQLIAHEYSHALGSRQNNVNSTISTKPTLKLNNSETLNLNKRNIIPTLKPKNWDEWSTNLHDSLPSEAKADIDALRFQLKKDGIYDTGTEDFTPELLKKAKEKYSNDFIMKRSFKAFKDDDLIWLMNNIANNNSLKQEDIFYAQKGGLVRGGTDAVRSYQQFLNKEFNTNLIEDGAWGDSTQAAYEKFILKQKSSTEIPNKNNYEQVSIYPKNTNLQQKDNVKINPNLYNQLSVYPKITENPPPPKFFTKPAYGQIEVYPTGTDIKIAQQPEKISPAILADIRDKQKVEGRLVDNRIIKKDNISATPSSPLENPKDETPSRFEELIQSIKTEGLFNTGSQVLNYLEQKLTPVKEDIKIKPVIKISNKPIESVGDTVKQGNRFYTPLKIDVNKTANFGFRNRGDDKDLDTEGIVFNTFFPFKSKNEEDISRYKGYDVLGIDEKTGKIQIGGTELLKDSSNTHFTPLHKAVMAKDISFDTTQKDPNLDNRAPITLVTEQGEQPFNRVMLGKNNDPNALVNNYGGGKMILATPDNKNTEIVYGTADQIKKMFLEFKKKNKLEFVKVYGGDGKAFSQTYQTLNKKITGKELNAFDNTNSSGGNVLYLKK